MTLLKKLIAALVLLPGLAAAAESNFPLDRAPDHTRDLAALQNGAKLFVNYCLNCHAASLMRYNKLQELGLTPEQVKNNLMFTSDKVGDMMTIAMSPKDAKAWFGANPPDLSVIARAKASSAGSGPDWLYTYLRTYYKDDTRTTGWNNMAYPNVGMPHALWELQGIRAAKYSDEKDPHDPSKTVKKFVGFEQVTPGTMSALEYDKAVADLVSFMTWMAEPAQHTRKRLGVWVLLFLGVFIVITWRLNASYWKHVK
ncbi:MAG: cytochrome c1 [Oxalicibacterium faecigallinarum]|uniref:Cytochrome c n=1 Tax=Oxalicibacterium faecigallinarum TaxID=573741 RepID=A0A8J3AQG7_9BURK|nr:cytochrome c1 [Oxalicibacterium faecigallinarum]MDQ7969102.1 cytochrome c1 [Oxalicibacterium faecigallinarum]GGI19706.1 cytochrome c [Oxalicibacterium faecigallinarum]